MCGEDELYELRASRARTAYYVRTRARTVRSVAHLAQTEQQRRYYTYCRRPLKQFFWSTKTRERREEGRISSTKLIDFQFNKQQT